LEDSLTREPLSPPPPLEVGTPVFAGLSAKERIAFRIVHRMNRRPLKRVWAWVQRTIGARIVGLACSNLLQVRGFEHIDGVSRERPVLLVANHRSYFDMYVVSTILHRRSPEWTALYFPVRGRFFYQSATGVFVNAIFASWSMYPPFFRRPETRVFDQYALRLLIALCREGRGHVIGFHPEGTRNKGPDPYSFLRAQPGVGQVIKEARPQVIPVFVAGLDNSALRQMRANLTGGDPVRVHFGPPIDFGAQLDKPDRSRTYLEIAQHVMREIAELAEQDRRIYAVTGDRLQA
jgi:1-acyl-sn-glycerol-3-phosphate acyltransferase